MQLAACAAGVLEITPMVASNAIVADKLVLRRLAEDSRNFM
ncbi:MAG TPA: hypothetical protein VGK20_01615 [Candidatus Binatia bacterium]|jgi:hypothetical protein